MKLGDRRKILRELSAPSPKSADNTVAGCGSSVAVGAGNGGVSDGNGNSVGVGGSSSSDDSGHPSTLSLSNSMMGPGADSDRADSHVTCSDDAKIDVEMKDACERIRQLMKVLRSFAVYSHHYFLLSIISFPRLFLTHPYIHSPVIAYTNPNPCPLKT